MYANSRLVKLSTVDRVTQLSGWPFIASWWDYGYLWARPSSLYTILQAHASCNWLRRMTNQRSFGVADEELSVLVTTELTVRYGMGLQVRSSVFFWWQLSLQMRSSVFFWWQLSLQMRSSVQASSTKSLPLYKQVLQLAKLIWPIGKGYEVNVLRDRI